MENLTFDFLDGMDGGGSASNDQTLSMREFTRKAYLNYSMYVILDRALPHIADGFKPVQRRIVYAMSELGLRSTAKYKKSARTVGDVLGKYHPHGDSACYEAMVLMAQSFSYRYPLIDGQGNWGSIDDPKSFAAMRYTESRLSPYAQALLAELGQGTVQWQPNFDGTMHEPVTLPAQVPNVLLNGGTGIAVGMSTDIPPHNLNEVIDACLHLLAQPQASIDTLCQYIPGPDFPSKAEIISPKEDLAKIYHTGHGSLKMRAVYEVEQGEIIITGLPFQVSGAKLLEQIAQQMQNKKLNLVSDLRDESDHENPIRLVITPRSNRVDVEQLMAHLFATTDLEKNYRVNLNMIGLDGRPRVKNLHEILTEWLQFRTESIRLRLQYRLDKVLARLYILAGFLIAFLNIDEVIQIIREHDKPKPVLIERFGLDDSQAEAILDLKLRNLAKLEEMKIRGEQDKLAAQRDEIQAILGSESLLKKQVATELEQAKATYGDDRRSQLVQRQEAKALKTTEMMPAENVTIIMSKLGWVRRAKGHNIDGTTLQYKAGDAFLAQTNAKTNQVAIFLDDQGRSYALPVHKLPSARSFGDPLTSYFNLPQGSQFNHVLAASEHSQFLLGSDVGFGFIARVSDMISKNKAGKALVTVPAKAQVLPPVPVQELAEQMIVIATKQGRLLAFAVSSLPAMAKGKGNKMIGILPADAKSRHDYIVNWTTICPGQELLLHAGKKYLRLAYQDFADYQGERGRRGKLLPNGYRKVTAMMIQ